MASVREKGVSGYCDTMYRELSGMKEKLLGFVREIEEMTGPEKEMLKTHIPHFQDIVRTIEWKLEILTRVCPFDWKAYSGEVERSSVRVEEEMPEKETMAGGYLGG